MYAQTYVCMYDIVCVHKSMHVCMYVFTKARWPIMYKKSMYVCLYVQKYVFVYILCMHESSLVMCVCRPYVFIMRISIVPLQCDYSGELCILACMYII